MTSARLLFVVQAAVVFLVYGCDKGLAPPEKAETPLTGPSGFSGVVQFVNWPPPDQALELRLVAFVTYPSDSASIIAALLNGTAVVFPPIGATGFTKFVDSLHYEFTTDGTTLQVQKYDYVAMALRYGTNFFSDWEPVGVYTKNSGTFDPAPVEVQLHRILRNIDIQVDFNHLPPKPWK
jgi:hypothetical protein